MVTPQPLHFRLSLVLFECFYLARPLAPGEERATAPRGGEQARARAWCCWLLHHSRVCTRPLNLLVRALCVRVNFDLARPHAPGGAHGLGW